MDDILCAAIAVLAFILGILFGNAITEAADIPAEKTYAVLSVGEPLCEHHGGMKAWDGEGNITCGNGFVIDTDTGK